MRALTREWAGAALAAVVVAIGSPAAAQPVSGGEAALTEELESLRARDAESQAKIESLEQRLRMLEALVGLTPEGAPLTDEEQATLRGRAAAPPVGALRYGDMVALIQAPEEGGGAVVTGASEEEGDRKEPAPTEAVEAVTRSEQGYFGDRLSFEAGLTYSHFDDARINLSGFLALDAIFLGLISLDEITADVIAADFTARYGLTDRLQFDVNVPYLYRHSNFSSGGAGGDAAGLTEADVEDSGLGDLNVGAGYRLLRETVRRPDIVLNARVKIPTGRHPFGVELIEVAGSEGNLSVPEKLSTGTGVWGASTGISMLKTLDPMVVFGSITYFYNFAHSFRDLDEAGGDQPGRAKIGDAIQYGAGVAFALNERSSLSMSFTQRLIERTRLRREGGDWYDVVGSQANVGLLNLGATFALTDRITLLSTVSVGMTTDAPDMVLSVRLPFRF